MSPRGRNCDGWPVWEPPVFRYFKVIDKEEYEKKREALLKHFGNERAKATVFMDIDTEIEQVFMYKTWHNGEDYIGKDRDDTETESMINAF